LKKIRKHYEKEGKVPRALNERQGCEPLAAFREKPLQSWHWEDHFLALTLERLSIHTPPLPQVSVCKNPRGTNFKGSQGQFIHLVFPNL